MCKQKRVDIIKQIQKKRDSHLISYITSTRPGLEVQMAMDCIRKVYDHLRPLSKPKEQVNVDLFIHL